MMIMVDNGKYLFRVTMEGGPSIAIDRHGETWHRQHEAYNAIHSMMAELDAARVVVHAVREAAALHAALHASTHPFQVAVFAALQAHDRLVDDRQPPSEWAVPVKTIEPTLRPFKPDKLRVDRGDYIRVSGDAECSTCGLPYYEHATVKGYEFLRRACDGRLLKL